MGRIAQAARDAGIEYCSSASADELFGGYPWHHLPERGRFASRRRSPAALLRRWRTPKSAPDPIPVDPIVVRGREAPCRSVGGPGCRQRSSPISSLYLPHLLNRDDRMTMMRSVEARMPFLDPELAGLALNLPSRNA